MTTIIFAFAALCFINISIVAGQIISPKTCAELGMIPVSNFRKASYMGLWYIQEHIPWVDNADCYETFYVSTGSNTALNTNSYHVFNLSLDESFDSLTVFDENGTGYYTFKSIDGRVDLKITVLSTDYYNYAVEGSCIDLGDHSESWYYVMTRSRTVSRTTQEEIDTTLQENNVDRTKMKKIRNDINTCVNELSGGLLGGLLKIVTTLLG